ncbi:hypothetical protein [Methylovirgula sp. 4M-Z18]|uniref:hypothetical protein n=1 Tax=Methylovirgula sp. 4M-Z18 TaxID=2293567 RepID=UPI000E2F1F6C|nr:hypothetical protein [Methylovirgula sp. 4M-Z18]RFB80650.1 hypothetical protein DYH55_03870 [Methylovirgula sp. 4M-Z18]
MPTKISIFAALIAIVAALIWGLTVFPHLPMLAFKSQLVAHLRCVWEAKESEFDRRVRAAFPMGSSAQRMVAELRQQGFSEHSESLMNDDYVMMRGEIGSGCEIGAQVFWRSAERGQSSEVEGWYGLGNCS